MAGTTRSSNLPNFEYFDPSMHAGNELKAFKQWIRRFENRYAVVTNVAADESEADKEQDKKRWLLNYVDDNVLDNFETLYDTEALYTAATYSDVIMKYKEQLKPTQTITLQRHRFHLMVQKDGESFDGYVSRVKTEIVYCEYSCANDITSITRDQIVTGVKNAAIRANA